MTCEWCGLELPQEQSYPICECCSADGITTCQICQRPTDDGAVCDKCGF